jgi:hypothetical protein
VEKELLQSGQISQVLSVAAWIPSEPNGRGIGITVAQSAYRRRLEKSREELVSTTYLDTRDNAELWRVSIRIPFLKSTDFRTIKTSLPEIAKATLAKRLPESQATVTHTGVTLLYHVAQDQLIRDMYNNFVLAFVLICPLMMLVLRSVKEGLVSMIPNLAPVVNAYGLIGWFDYPLDVGLTMTACIALGIAVDGTTHFMLRFQDVKTTMVDNPVAAINATFHQCARAMSASSLIVIAGLSVFMFSPLAAAERFAALMIALLAIALVCDLVLTPTLLKIIQRTPTQPSGIQQQDDEPQAKPG